MDPTPSLWLDGIPAGERARRPPLPGDTEADVAIIGAGYTGLWTAYYLSRLAPERRVVVIDAEHAGFGASGRNGGWCTTEMPRLLGTLVRRHGPMAAMRMHRAVRRTLPEINSVLAAEGIDCDWRQDGSLYVARTESQHARLLSWQESMRQVGLTDLQVLDGPAARERLHLPGIRAAGFTPNCAAVQPARIARGLAEAVVRRGVLLAERTRAVRVLPRRVVTDHGTVRARSIVCATEAYTGRLLGHGRRVLPVGSHVIATEPLPRHFWEGLGWHDRVTVTDSRYHFAYLQRTADDRLVLGGRGADYRYASRTDGRTRPNPTYRRLVKALTDFFPALSGVPVSHYWTGIYGLHRDAEPSVVYDPSTGLGYAGGYGGEGIVLSNLAGRTMAALVADVDRAETRLCWVNRQPRSWEPEPLRFLGVRGASALAMHADNYERRTGRAAPVAGRLLRTLT